jgi:hypothetical protein
MLSFVLAEKLGMTVRALQEQMTGEELLGWAAFIEAQQLAQQAAERKAARRR